MPYLRYPYHLVLPRPTTTLPFVSHLFSLNRLPWHEYVPVNCMGLKMYAPVFMAIPLPLPCKWLSKKRTCLGVVAAKPRQIERFTRSSRPRRRPTLSLSLSSFLSFSLRFFIGVLNEPESLVVDTLFELTFYFTMASTCQASETFTPNSRAAGGAFLCRTLF